MQYYVLTLLSLTLFIAACGDGSSTQNEDENSSKLVLIEVAESGHQKDFQTALINARPGDTLEFPKGTYDMSASLSLDGIDSVTLRGSTDGETIFNFANQQEGAEGFKIVANNITLENFTVQNMSGDGIKVNDSENVTFRRVKVEWTVGPDSTHGAYGLYPVACTNLLIEDCVLTGASDAGAYVGQSENVIVRNNVAHSNVQGIAVENCTNVLVENNETYNNTVGISVYNLPELPVIKNGHTIKVINNDIRENNHDNFGAVGSIVGMVPAGTGILVLAGNDVEINGNRVLEHQTVGTAILSYQITDRKYDDSLYYPYSKAIYVVGNTYSRADTLIPDMKKDLGVFVASVFPDSIPDIMYDGFVDTELANDDGLMDGDNRICIQSNTGASFANLDGTNDLAGLSFDISSFDCTREAIPPVEL